MSCRLQRGLPARAVEWDKAAYRVASAALGGRQNQVLLPQGGSPLDQRLHLHVHDRDRDLPMQVAAAAESQALPFRQSACVLG